LLACRLRANKRGSAFRWADIGHLHDEPAAYLTIAVLGKTDRARLRDSFEARRDVDSVAHEVAVRFLDHVAEMNVDAELDALVGGTQALRSTMALWTSIAQRTASTTLRNSTMSPSPVRLTTRPWWTAIVGSIKRQRCALSTRASRPSKIWI
jgi:hypothetical protein